MTAFAHIFPMPSARSMMSIYVKRVLRPEDTYINNTLNKVRYSL